MTFLNLFRPGLGELFGLAVLSLMGIAMAFMVMTMAGGLESRATSDLGIGQSTNVASTEVTTVTSALNPPLERH